MRELKHKVEYILEHHENARNSDNSLVAFFIFNYFPESIKGNYVDLATFKKMPNFYDLVRYRQKIQNEDKKFLPTNPKVLQKRFNKQIEVRKEFGYNPEFAEPILNVS